MPPARSSSPPAAPVQLLLLFSYCLLRELPPGGGSRTPCRRAHTETATASLLGRNFSSLVFLCGPQPDIDRRQNREHVCLNDRHENVQRNESYRNQCRENPENHAKNRRLPPTPRCGANK